MIKNCKRCCSAVQHTAVNGKLSITIAEIEVSESLVSPEQYKPCAQDEKVASVDTDNPQRVTSRHFLSLRIQVTSPVGSPIRQ